VAGLTAVVLVAGTVPLLAGAQGASAASSELFFSEYVEGSGNNKALEVYNGTGAAVNLATGGYNVQMFFNGSASAGLTINLTGTVADGEVFVPAQSTAAPEILAQADQTNGSAWFNGNDAVVLRKGTTVLDVIGQVGTDPGAEWGTGLTSTMDNTLRRKASVHAGDPVGDDAFDPALEWDGFATNTFGGLGSHTVTEVDTPPTVASTSPASNATAVARDANLAVTFSEPVTLAGDWFTLTCSASGNHAATVSGGPAAYVLDPTTDFADNDSCTLTVVASGVTDLDGTPDAMAGDAVVPFTTAQSVACTQPYTPIPEIQGDGATVALTGTRTTQGVVVADYEGPSPALRGFYLQDPVGDGNPATSDGIFVFEGSNADTVKVGDVVRVTGTAAENQGQSQISVGTITRCGTGSVTPTPISFPVQSDTYLERYEGMNVTVPQAMTVTEHFQLGRFGQVVVSSGGRLQQPTNVVAPGAAAAALQASNNLRRLIIDDASQAQNPDPIVWGRVGKPLSATNTLRGGDTVTDATGVMTYTWAGNAASGNAYRLRPIGSLGGAAEFVAANSRPSSPPAVGGDVRVVGMNLLNFFNTLDTAPNNCRGGLTGDLMDCRGANSTVELERQWTKTVAAVNGTGADVVAFMEMENDGYGPGSAEQFLVDRLNAATAPGTWAFIDADRATGQVDALGNDAIKVGMLYKPDKVTPVGRTAALNSLAFVNGGTSKPRNRPALAQAFQDTSTGGVFLAVANHLKSKGSGCAVDGNGNDVADDAGDGQGNCNVVRTRAAGVLADWLATDPTGTGDPDVLLLGDLNSYAKEDPIATLESKGFASLIADRNGPEAYSYVFDGQWGYLDHALGSASMRNQVTGVGDWHINSDEPSVLDYNTDFKTPNLVESLYAPDQFRISDHDPVVVGLSLTNSAPVVGTVTGPVAAVSVGAPAAISAAFSDADRVDTHTATVEWGDGSSSAGTVDGGTVSGSHTYSTAGSYTVRVTVTDQWGHRGASTLESVVVYDPAAGFATGGGWVSSPAGALMSNPGHTGKGSFQLNATYSAGATRPGGSLTYSLSGTQFALGTTSLDWLVVTGDTARLAGPATLNGSAGYRVLATLTDRGKADTLRVAVTDGSGAVVYDSGAQAVQGQVTLH
jgi:predicted extracellular nuclease